MTQEERLRKLRPGIALAAARYGISVARLADYRDCAMALKRFDVAAYADTLGVSATRARSVLRALMDLEMIHPTGGGWYAITKPKSVGPHSRPRSSGEVAGTPTAALRSASRSAPVAGTGKSKFPKWAERYIKAAAEQGWQPTISGGGHIKLVHPSGDSIIMSATPSDRRATQNNEAFLRSKGIAV